PAAELCRRRDADLSIHSGVARDAPAEAAIRELRRIGALRAAVTAHAAADVGELPSSRRWWRTAKRMKSQLSHLRIPLLASGVAFWAVLSIFPAVIALITVYGLVSSPDDVRQQVEDLSGSLSADTRSVLESWLNDVVTA
nr:YhjD/YihY/BrkB family envelope integrity protein [Micromonospora sp. DSM 115978]